MSEYGYIPNGAVEQTYRSNKGLLTPTDIYNLTKDNKMSTLGDLELIETQNISGTPSLLDFDNLQTNKYDIHFMTISNYKPQTDDRHLGMRFKVGGTNTSSTQYEYAMVRDNTSASTPRSAGDSKVWLAYNIGLNREGLNGHIYIFDAGDSAKMTFMTSQFVHLGVGIDSNFQSSMNDITQAIDGISFATSGGNHEHGEFTLYGIRR